MLVYSFRVNAIPSFLKTNNMITQQKNSVKTGSKANGGQAADLIREYKKTRWSPNSERIGKPDSLSAWYSIEDMENFLALVKSKGGDGIRFYYGAYPEDFAAKPEYAGRQTLAPVGTRSKITETGTKANKDIYYPQNGRLKILSGNMPGGGTICPPNCPPPSEGGMGDLGITIVDQGEKGMVII
jgi:hypothetical protein